MAGTRRMLNKMMREAKLSAAMSVMAEACPHLRHMSTRRGVPVQHMTESLTNDDVKLFIARCPFAAVLKEHALPVGATSSDAASSFHHHEAVQSAMRPESESDIARSQMTSVCVGEGIESAVEVAPTEAVAPCQPRSGYDAVFSGAVEELKQEHKYRVFTTVKRRVGEYPRAKAMTEQGDRDITMWCSNDYLGMAQNGVVLEAMKRAIDQHGAGSGGTRNISGNTYLHEELECELADWHGHEKGLLFGSCYNANASSIPALVAALGPDTILYSDEENHASMIEGIRASGARKHIFRHNDVLHLRELLAASDPAVPKIILFESVYSMDGSVGPVEEICALAKEFNAITFLDEVHAVGMYGASGGGITEREGLSQSVDLISGTLGKAVGVYGGYITGRSSWIDVIRSSAKGFIFSTSLPPAIVSGALASIRHLRAHPELRAAQQRRVASVKMRLDDAGIPVLANASHIVPVMVGDPLLCKRLGDELREQHGVYVQPINYPTVASGTERFRLTPGPAHTDEMEDHLISSFVRVWDGLGVREDASVFAGPHGGVELERIAVQGGPQAGWLGEIGGRRLEAVCR